MSLDPVHLFVLGILGPSLSPESISPSAAEYLILRNALASAPIERSRWITLGDITTNGPVRLSETLQLNCDAQLPWASMPETWDAVESFYKTIQAFTERLTEKSTFVLVYRGVSVRIAEGDAESESFIIGDLDPRSSDRYLLSEFFLKMALEQGPGQQRRSRNFVVTNLPLDPDGIDGLTVLRPDLACVCELSQSAELANPKDLNEQLTVETLWSQIVSPITSPLGLPNHAPFPNLGPITCITRPTPPPPSLATRYRKHQRWNSQWMPLHESILKELAHALVVSPPCHTNDTTHIIGKCHEITHRNALEYMSELDKRILLEALQRRQRLRRRAVDLAYRLGWISDEAFQVVIESNFVEMDSPFNTYECREITKEMEGAGFEELKGWLEMKHGERGKYVWMEPTAWFAKHWGKNGKCGIGREEWERVMRG